MAAPPEPLRAEELRWKFQNREAQPPSKIEGLSTEKFIGQERAERALLFGLKVRSHDFNIYIAGAPGTGKETMCRSICSRLACRRPAPSDVAFVNNFVDPDRPICLIFPAGVGQAFRQDMENLIEELRESIPKAFEEETYENQRKEIVEATQSQQRAKFTELERKAKDAGFALRMTQTGLSLIPLIGGEPATEETYAKLTPQDIEQIEKERAAFSDEVNDFIKQTRQLEKELRAKMRELEKNIALTAVQGPVEEVIEKYKDFEKAASHIEEVKKHILTHVKNFLPSDEEAQGLSQILMRRTQEENPFRAYEVNLAIDNSQVECAPVVYETNPTFNNLFGRIERRAVFGAYTTDFTMVRAGSMIAASGGFLILNALDALTNPGVWPALKRAIRNKCVRIEDLGEMYGWTQSSLKPEPVPVNVKVVLIGSPYIYYLLLRLDEDFSKLFKVKADFSSVIDRTRESMQDFLAFIEFHQKESDLLSFDDMAVARVIEDSTRHVSHKEKLSAHFSRTRELLLEADHWAREAGASVVSEEHVLRALEEKRFRANLIDERLKEQIVEGTLMIDVEGAVVGQVNGLAVFSLGDYSFGKPSRITARTFMGEKGVVNIERESKLSGNIHDKGVLILQGYLGATYAQKHPLALSASICFEQQYSGVEGDSASSTELYAILSSLSGLPIKQSLAVTGSVNQLGMIQAIGGVNEKIEGFFEVCREKGALTGEQGVLIPHQNVKNLMLNDEVIQAVKEGKFRIYPVRTIDEGISLLTGVPSGERDPQTGEYPPETVHGRAEARLKQFLEDMMRLRRAKEEAEEEEGKKKKKEEKPPEPPEPPPHPPRRQKK